MRKLSTRNPGYSIILLLLAVRIGKPGLRVARCRRTRSINESKMILRGFSRKVYFSRAPSVGPFSFKLLFVFLIECCQWNVINISTVYNFFLVRKKLHGNLKTLDSFPTLDTALTLRVSVLSGSSAHALVHDHRSIDQGTIHHLASSQGPNAETRHTSKGSNTGPNVQRACLIIYLKRSSIIDNGSKTLFRVRGIFFWQSEHRVSFFFLHVM